MPFPWEIIDQLRTFFQLDFIFTGLETSSAVVLAARLAVFALFGGGLIWALVKIVLKALECLQTLITTLAKLPAVFYLLLILVLPLSPNSVGAQWIGYIVLVTCVFGLAGVALLALVMWKYGVDRMLDLISSLRRDSSNTRRDEARRCEAPTGNADVFPASAPPLSDRDAPSWSPPT